jgi:hypothetical protein
MKPTIGRIVHLLHNPDTLCAAIVVNVVDDGTDEVVDLVYWTPRGDQGTARAKLGGDVGCWSWPLIPVRGKSDDEKALDDRLRVGETKPRV